jgi:hypothetical protein
MAPLPKHRTPDAMDEQGSDYQLHLAASNN